MLGHGAILQAAGAARDNVTNTVAEGRSIIPILTTAVHVKACIADSLFGASTRPH